MPKILVADDEEVLRMLIVDTLEDEGYELEEAVDGEEAYQLFLENDYDLLLVDYMMPGMTGVELLKKVREHEEKGQVKTLMLTAKSQQRDIEEAKAAGADYFLSKPFSPVKLIGIVEDILDG